MTNDDTTHVLCIATDRPAPAPSMPVTCDACGTGIWLSDETRAELGRLHPGTRLTPVCLPCGVALVREHNAEVQVTPLQRHRFGVTTGHTTTRGGSERDHG